MFEANTRELSGLALHAYRAWMPAETVQFHGPQEKGRPKPPCVLISNSPQRL
jgi:hypothetical protein